MSISASRSDRLALLLLLARIFCPAAEADTIKLASWNLDWLTLLPRSSPLLPSAIPYRQDADWNALALTASHLDADIVAVQEVTDEAALRRLFPAPRYRLVMSHAPIAQNVGLVLRAPWIVTAHATLDAFDRSATHGGHPLRPGLDVTISNGQETLRLLVVHLKSGCWERSWNEKDHSCPILREQIDLIADWMTERDDEGEAYSVLGDFNRRFTPQDPYYLQMTQDMKVTLVTAGLSSPCEGGTYFIDHIVLGGAARNWLIPDSLRVRTYREFDPARLLSDHCPVSVRLNMPDRVSSTHE